MIKRSETQDNPNILFALAAISIKSTEVFVSSVCFVAI